MSKDSKVCECSHNTGNPYDGISLNKIKTKCCTEETTEFSNTNTLMTFKTELPQDINVLGALAISYIIDLNLNTNQSVDLILDKAHFPNLDIPILTSSLLI